jgi:hypothetical protein
MVEGVKQEYSDISVITKILCNHPNLKEKNLLYIATCWCDGLFSTQAMVGRG